MINKKNTAAAGVFAVLCILINIGGKALANALELPLWLDSFGTMAVAYIYGPLGGAIVGAATNIAFYIGQPVYWGYALTSVAVGVIIGWCARKRLLTSLFGVLTAGFLVTLSSVVISTPFNLIFFGGSTGNKWGDGVIAFLESRDWNNWNPVISAAAGEFYVDFADKVITVLLIAKAAAVYRKFGGKKLKRSVKSLLSIGTALLLCAAVIPASASAKENSDYNDYLRTVYNNENGLPCGTANDIAQTGDGVLWIGTNSGLYRYKGNDFRLMSDFSSVKNVNCLCVDEEGRLWIGTGDKGLSICINNEPVNALTHKDGLPSDSVRCIAESGSGFYYVGTTGALALVSLTNGINVAGVIPEITCAKSISVNGEYAAVVNDAEELYLLKDSGITHKISGFTCCKFDENGELYVGTSGNTIEIYNINGGRLVKKASVSCGELSHFNSFELSETGEIMLCAENGAGYLDNNRTFHPIALGKFASSIGHTLFDYQGNLWFTSSKLGLIKFCRSPFTEIFTKTGIEENVVNAVTKWRGDFYFGTDSGLYAADNALSEKLENFLTERLRGVHISCLMSDGAGRLWICTSENGVYCADSGGDITVYNSETGALGDKFRSAIETRQGSVILAGDSGVTFIENNAVTKTTGEKNGLSNPRTLCLLEAKSGEILAGTDGNGIAVIKNGSVERILTTEDGLSSDIVTRIVADDADNSDGCFIVTSNSLCYMDKEYNIRVLESFPYYSNYDIIKRGDGMLFVTGSAGVYVIDRESLLSDCAEHILLEYSRGLRISLAASSWNYVDENGTLYLCGGTGVVSFGLYEYSPSHRSYRMSLQHIEVDGEKYEAGKAVKIPRGANIVRVSPDIVNYSINDPLVRIYLEGYDEKPQTMQLSALSDCVYANIPTGEYVFRMAVLDDKGNVVSENSYKIIKEKEIYDEPWFMVYFWAVFVTAIFYLAWMIFRTQLQRSMNIQKRELEVARQQVEMGNEAIMTIAHTVDAKDQNTSEHSFRVSEYSVMIAKKLGYDDNQCEELRKTALLHDIGKIGIPDSVLNKPAKLTDEEYGIMKTHVVKGAEILRHFTTIKNIVEGAQYHHERYDGRGYMQGLKGEEIPINARIIGIADAFDAMTANRVYRKQLDIDFVLAELKRCRGTQFDPKLTDIMLGLIEDGTIQVEKLYEESKERTSE